MLKRPTSTEDDGTHKYARRERLFTRQEVEQIVEEALNRKVAELQDLYNRRLQQELQAHFSAFQTHHHDHHQTKASDFSYLN